MVSIWDSGMINLFEVEWKRNAKNTYHYDIEIPFSYTKILSVIIYHWTSIISDSIPIVTLDYQGSIISLLCENNNFTGVQVGLRVTYL